MDNALVNVVQALEAITDLTTHLARNPERLSQLRKSLNQPLLSQTEIRELPLEETRSLFKERESETHGLLREALKAIYRIFLETEIPEFAKPSEGFVMGITKKGGAYLIPISLLKKRGLGVGL